MASSVSRDRLISFEPLRGAPALRRPGWRQQLARPCLPNRRRQRVLGPPLTHSPPARGGPTPRLSAPPYLQLRKLRHLATLSERPGRRRGFSPPPAGRGARQGAAEARDSEDRSRPQRAEEARESAGGAGGARGACPRLPLEPGYGLSLLLAPARVRRAPGPTGRCTESVRTLQCRGLQNTYCPVFTLLFTTTKNAQATAGTQEDKGNMGGNRQMWSVRFTS
ncbi:hypothetical protein NDU88_001398 [Pleurodeles waltl]|uniref:Uncharacterized protein n=1 Tax=Pleurodeles waltl TaxID=8319 RepID=A0AAV7L0M7_PLEWA|nr:hypothetical protein NDU88_001398 [Pleurodeles waltl]